MIFISKQFHNICDSWLIDNYLLFKSNKNILFVEVAVDYTLHVKAYLIFTENVLAWIIVNIIMLNSYFIYTLSSWSAIAIASFSKASITSKHICRSKSSLTALRNPLTFGTLESCHMNLRADNASFLKSWCL